MTPEKLYETTCRLLRNYDSATGNTAAGAVIAHPDHFDKSLQFPFYADCASILIDCLIDMDKKKPGSKPSLPAMRRIIKGAMNDRLQGMFPITDAEGVTWHILCDGHRLVRMTEDYASLPHPEKPGLTDKVVSDFMEAPLSRYGAKEVELPTVTEIKAYIASQRARVGRGQPIIYRFDTFAVNAEYMLDMLQVLPGCVAYEPEKSLSPIYFKAECGDGVLLPVHIYLA